jgi:hypothetical protein
LWTLPMHIDMPQIGIPAPWEFGRRYAEEREASHAVQDGDQLALLPAPLATR